MKRIKSSLDKKVITKKLTGYGIVALVIISLIFLNAILTIVGDKNNWYSDMTKGGLFTISDELTDLLDETDIANGIEIIFCCDEDYAKDNYTSLEQGKALSYVHSTATQIASRYEEISILYRDVQRDPQFFRDNFQEIERFLTGISDPIIIAKKGVDGKYGTHFKVYSARAFYGFETTNNTLYAYNGEAVFASAILSLSHIEAPTVYFTTEHFETTTSYVNGESVPCELWNLFLSCGFEVATINLKDTPIPENASLVVINAPQIDFAPEEMEALSLYLDKMGNVMFFADPDKDEEYTNLYSKLKDIAGVDVDNEGDDVIYDPGTKDLGGNEKDLTFRAELSSSNAATVYLSYLKDPNSAKAQFSNSTSVTIDPEYMTGEGKYFMKNYAFTQPLYQTADTAIKNGEDGEYIVMTMTSLVHHYDGKDGAAPHTETSYLLFVPSDGFASDAILSDTSRNANKDILLSITHVITSAQTPVNITFKVFENHDLVITEQQAKTTTACLIIIPTALIIAVGAVVIIRRKIR